MTRRCLLWCELGLWVAAAGATAAELSRTDALALMKQAAAAYDKTLLMDFHARMRCPEAEAAITMQLLALGIAWEPRFELISENGQQSVKPILDTAPEASRKMVENSLHSLGGTHVRLLEHSRSYLSFVKAIPDSAAVDVIRTDADAVEFELNDLREPFLGGTVRSCRVRLRRPENLLAMVALDFGSNQTLVVKWEYKPITPPGAAAPVLFPVRTEFQQSVSLIELRNPFPRFSVSLDNIRFVSTGELAAKNAERQARRDAFQAEVLKLRDHLRQFGASEEKRVWTGQYSEGGPLINLDLSGVVLTNLDFLAGLRIRGLKLDSPGVTNLAPLAGLALEWLDLSRAKVADLSPLRGKKLQVLYLQGTQVRELSPLAGMPLNRLILNSSPVSDLSPLRGMPLRDFRIANTNVRDLSPLAGMKLERFHVGNKNVTLTDISVLRGMPLKQVSFEGARGLTDLHPLAECRDLEWLILPPEAQDIEFLRQMPKLKSLSRKGKRYGWEPDMTAEEFWKEYDAAKAKK